MSDGEGVVSAKREAQAHIFRHAPDLTGLKSKIFLGGREGGMPPDPPIGCTSHSLLCFANYSDQVHTGTPLFKIIDPPLIGYKGQAGFVCASVSAFGRQYRLIICYNEATE